MEFISSIVPPILGGHGCSHIDQFTTGGGGGGYFGGAGGYVRHVRSCMTTCILTR